MNIMVASVPDGLGVRIPGFHPGGPGSIPGLGEFLAWYFALSVIIYHIKIIYFILIWTLKNNLN